MGNAETAGEDLEATGDEAITGGLPTHHLRKAETLRDAAMESARTRRMRPIVQAVRSTVQNQTGPSD